ncbi:response regulator transcription factor [Clostridium pasteurianum]|uniref:Stage 0 sporulation protein A homolog n=1 Tax=Clostridium pasteurianum BC1 TaxID=86416 RepID=R4K643_CLOPA|nr:response regulator transcription factor [Clostridium pasteurianum]AGK95989.1 response regulator with CheY-like receiver domain and winged-helix DNA-binding domain [Clostridium pasteurianum BC1]
MSNEKILIIEDDEDIRNLLRDYLTSEGFTVQCCHNGGTAVSDFNSFNPDIIILDIMLPEIDGIEICRTIRSSSHIPVVMISAKSGDIDKILSLGVGADDYITKPFSPMEVIARIKAHLRRYKTFSTPLKNIPDKKEFGQLIIDSKSYKVTYKDKEIHLTSREFEIIDFLSQYPSQVFSKEQLYDNVWGLSGFGDLNTIAVYVKRIREKLSLYNVNYIKTVWGVGYKWEEDLDE